MEDEDCSSEVDPLLITDPLEVDVNQLVKLEPDINLKMMLPWRITRTRITSLRENQNWVTPTRLGATVMGS